MSKALRSLVVDVFLFTFLVGCGILIGLALAGKHSDCPEPIVVEAECAGNFYLDPVWLVDEEQ